MQRTPASDPLVCTLRFTLPAVSNVRTVDISGNFIKFPEKIGKKTLETEKGNVNGFKV